MAGFLDTIRQQTAEARTCEEMDVILQSLYEASKDAVAKHQIMATERGVLGRSIQSNMSYLTNPTNRRGFTDDGNVRHAAHMAPDQFMDLTRKGILDFCEGLERCEKWSIAPGMLGDVETAYQPARTAYLGKRQETLGAECCSMEEARQVSAHINAGGEVERDYNMKALREAYEKMESEHKLPTHKDSPQYTAMKEALRKVCDMQPGDPGMKKAMDELHDAAEAYAEKSAFTSKKTPNGIRRKNTSLLLMSLTDQGKTYHMLYEKNGLVDTRLKTFKKQTSFKSLMAEEMKRNERKYGARAEQRQARRRAEMAKTNPSVRTNDQAMTPSGR